MRDKYFYEVMFDDTSIDVSKEVGLVWSIANSLRGAYTSDKYKDVIIPMVIIRRFECALEATKDAVVAKHRLAHKPSLRLAFGDVFERTESQNESRLLRGEFYKR